jgi:hypothetical protein
MVRAVTGATTSATEGCVMALSICIFAGTGYCMLCALIVAGIFA